MPARAPRSRPSRAPELSGSVLRPRPPPGPPPRGPPPDPRSRRPELATVACGCPARSRSPRAARESSDLELSRWIAKTCRYPRCASLNREFACVFRSQELYATRIASSGSLRLSRASMSLVHGALF